MEHEASVDHDQRPVGLVFDDRYLAHDTGIALIDDRTPFPFAEPVPHVSSPALVGRAKQLIDLSGLGERMARLAATEADDEALLAYHTPAHLARVAALSAERGGDTGEGAPIGAGGDRIARLAAGGVIAAVDAVVGGAVRAAYALVRPPGHHAMADRGMGFCVYNNAVVAVRHAQRRHGVGKVLVLDWDVHHGNGTQDAFLADDTVLFVSLHQDDLYPPGWGALDQLGVGAGEGLTVNVPLPAGTGNAGYLAAFDRVVVPIARQFAPELVVVSAGQDASVLDPLARMAVTTAGYRAMAERMLAVAAEACAGRLVVTQEGGYAPTYAPYCTATIAATLVDGRPGGALPLADPYGERAETMPPSRVVGLDAERAIARAIEVHGRCWAL